ncbi:UNVERIFIED_CONTAM: hypothetical protein K2H54_065741, partial [Gekko kuhli]
MVCYKEYREETKRALICKYFIDYFLIPPFFCHGTQDPEDLGSGSYGHQYITDSGIGDDDGIDIDDSDYDIYIDEAAFNSFISCHFHCDYGTPTAYHRQHHDHRDCKGHQEEHCRFINVNIQYPQFFGYSYITFEPLKNSYQTFQISVEFRSEAEDGLLLYCGENEHGRGDFMSVAVIRRSVQFRFNCGTGIAIITSENKIKLGNWHRVTVFRDGSDGWLKLDNSPPVSGRSQGQYSKITFRTPFYLGGAPTAYWLVRSTGINRGYQGCVQSLNVNGKAIDMRPWPLGKALSGADVGECSSGICDEASCVNGGTCTASKADRYICLCPLGFKGRHCEEAFTLALPQFNATLKSFATTPWPLEPQNYLSFMEFEITFRPVSANGVLLYSYDTGSKDFLSIIMVDGFVEFRFDCGSGTAIIRCGKMFARYFTRKLFSKVISDRHIPYFMCSMTPLGDKPDHLGVRSDSEIPPVQSTHAFTMS